MAGAASLPASVDTATNTVAVGIHQEVFPQDLTGLSRYELPTGRKITIVHWFAQWGAWNSAFNRAALDAIAARGSIPLITWEPWAAAGPDPAWSLKNAILSGRNDAYIASWARGLAAYG
jgi:hypothetical protein